LLITTAIGFLHGWLITFFQLPSFIVTLAGLLAWNGVVLLIIGPGGTVNIQNPVVRNLASELLPPLWTWVVVVIAVALYALNEYWAMRTRLKAGLRAKPLTIVILQVALIAVIGAIMGYIFNLNRALNAEATPIVGMPVVAVIMLVLLAVLTYIAQNTRFG